MYNYYFLLIHPKPHLVISQAHPCFTLNYNFIILYPKPQPVISLGPYLIELFLVRSYHKVHCPQLKAGSMQISTKCREICTSWVILHPISTYSRVNGPLPCIRIYIADVKCICRCSVSGLARKSLETHPKVIPQKFGCAIDSSSSLV